jgi:hypothetical protein
LVTKKDGSKGFKKEYIPYLFVEADLSNGRVQEVLYKVVGVMGFMDGSGYSKTGEPQPISEEEVALMGEETREVSGGAGAAQKRLRPGMRVAVTNPESALYKQSFEVIDVSEDGRTVRLGINFFRGSQQTMLDLDVSQVEPL